jgi:hypothetical protein
MQHIEKIESELKKIRRWHLVPGKNNILKSLEQIIKKHEAIHSVIDGFFTPGDDNCKSDMQSSGVLIITSERGLFIRSDNPSEYLSVDAGDMRGISFTRGYAGLKLNIEADGERCCFVTHASEAEIRNIIGADVVTEDLDGKPQAPPSGQREALKPAPPVIRYLRSRKRLHPGMKLPQKQRVKLKLMQKNPSGTGDYRRGDGGDK